MDPGTDLHAHKFQGDLLCERKRSPGLICTLASFKIRYLIYRRIVQDSST